MSHIIVTVIMQFSLIFPHNWTTEIRKWHEAAHVSSQQSFVLSLWTYQDTHSSTQCFCLDPKHDERMILTFCLGLNFYVNRSVLRVEGRIRGGSASNCETYSETTACFIAVQWVCQSSECFRSRTAWRLLSEEQARQLKMKEMWSVPQAGHH